MQNNTPGERDNASDKKATEEVTDFVINYLQDKLKDTELPFEEDGMITVRGGGAGYMINRSKIITGEIDEDRSIDAIVPVYVLKGQSLMSYEHLIVLNREGKFVVGKTLSDIFNIIRIKNRNIFAEVSTVSPDSPGYGCEECREVVKYKYQDGDLVKVE